MIITVQITLLTLTILTVQADYNGIKLKDVSMLTFRVNQFSNSRRGQSVPQLKCIGSPIKCQYQPKQVKCRNVGVKNNGGGWKDVQWRCEADLDDGYSFDEVRVNCEPWNYPNDDYIVKGSCSLEYELDREKDHHHHHRFGPAYNKKENDNPKKIKPNWLLWAINMVPKRSAQHFFWNIGTFVGCSIVIYLIFFGWSNLSNRRQSANPLLSTDGASNLNSSSWSFDQLPNLRFIYPFLGFARAEAEESIYSTIIKAVLEFIYEKITKSRRGSVKTDQNQKSKVKE